MGDVSERPKSSPQSTLYFPFSCCSGKISLSSIRDLPVVRHTYIVQKLGLKGTVELGPAPLSRSSPHSSILGVLPLHAGLTAQHSSHQLGKPALQNRSNDYCLPLPAAHEHLPIAASSSPAATTALFV